MQKIRIKNYPMINPSPVVLVGADVNGKQNYATVGAFGFVCEKPVFYISLKNTHHTTIGVKESGYFSVNVPSTDLALKTDYCGMFSGKSIDKSILYTPFYDELGKAPMIMECPLNFLCKVVQSASIYGFEVFFGEIISTYLNEQCFTDNKPDPLKVNPMLIMGTNYFGLGEVAGNIFKDGLILKSNSNE